MKYDLTTPCGNCPFRRTGGIRLRPARVDEIAAGLERGDFPCHKTTIDCEDDDGCGDREATDKSQHCAGALILLEKMEQPSQMMRICERLGMYDRSKLAMGADVFDDFNEMRDAQRERRKIRGVLHVTNTDINDPARASVESP